jgi:hypothetical protein
MSKTPHSTFPYRSLFPPVDYLDGDDLKQPRKYMHPRLERSSAKPTLAYSTFAMTIFCHSLAVRIGRSGSPLSRDIAAFDHVGPAGAKRWYTYVTVYSISMSQQ